MSAPGLAARIAAADIIQGVLSDKRMIGELVEDLPRDLPGPSKARAQSLATMVLRNLEPLTIVLDQFLHKKPPARVLTILRIAAAEMLIDGIPPHAAVDAAVNAARADRKTAHLKNLVNAIARNISREGAEIWAEMEPQSLPHWLRVPLVRAYGEDGVAAIEQSHANGAPLDLTLRGDLPDGLEADEAPTGSYRIASAQVTALPGYEEGAFWVQDAAAALPAKVLGDVAGQTVLDLCAAPGGKTLQLAAAGAQVTSLDISGPRMKRVRENLARTGLDAELVTADALHWTPEQPFDAVLLDAPCTATGTIRRHPDLPFIKTGEENKGLVALQRKLLSRAADFVKPGGRLVYCTCSLLPSEGEVAVEKFLAENDAFTLEAIDAEALGGEAHWAKDGALRLRPDYWLENGGMDGFYIALLKKRG
ncbi:RsmB/NOP family class I SAM-dependent RNA methyltransferase [Pontivivens insulae]|uniref:Ribosomal RNA small subunit methyltransferase B n=1 Tax=Pontivivens insulae TaxID=1639689 RepID=A0A2R8A802_9RHOB|nr:transcription antitermination factor NusB [Pontivivens insulae]RED18466.1 16S rRNA (cytosine967-C5)-methyltransferase [Pontivivens insulae]SPF28364.1 Ribosomal RNA small subunit methyltransferase B [Pontivivens insulae]